MRKTLSASLVTGLACLAMAGIAHADDENMFVRVQNNTNTRMLLGPTQVPKALDRGHGWKEEARYIEAGSSANILRINDYKHLAKGQSYTFKTPVYTRNIDKALAHYLSRQMPTKAMKDSNGLVGIASFYDTSLLTYRMGLSKNEKSLVKANVGLVTQEGFLMKKPPKKKKSVKLSVFVQSTKRKELKRYATMADTPQNRRWLKKHKFKYLKTLGYMFKKAQPGTVPVRMYHSPGSTHTPYWKLAWAGGIIHSTASRKLALHMKEASYVENAIQGYIYPYSDFQKIKKAVTPQMHFIQKVYREPDGDLSIKSGFVHAGSKCKKGKVGKNGLCFLKQLKLKSPCIPGKTDCPYWVSSKYRGVFRKQRGKKRNKKKYPERCYEGKPDGDHNCIVARFTPSVKLPAQCEKAPQGKYWRSGGHDPKFRCPVFFNTDHGGIVFGAGYTEPGTWTGWTTGKSVRLPDAKETFKESGGGKNRLTVTAVTNTTGRYNAYYRVVRNDKPVFWQEVFSGVGLRKQPCKARFCCSKGFERTAKKLKFSHQCIPRSRKEAKRLKRLPKQCGHVTYPDGCMTRTIVRKGKPKKTELKPNPKGLFQAFSHQQPVNTKTKGVPWVNSYLLSLVSAIVYEEQPQWRQKYYAALGLKEFRFLDSQKLKTGEDQQMSVLHFPKAKKNKGAGTVILAIRGSTGNKGDALNPLTPEEDWGTNFEVAPVTRAFAGGGALHAGYAHGLDALYPSFAYKTKPLLTQLIDAKRKAGQLKKGQGLDVWITGHSMGGAVAHVFAHWLAAKKKQYSKLKKPKRWQRDLAELNIRGVITFAAPMSHGYLPGTPLSKKHYNKTLKMAHRTLRWENYRDTVPPMPNSMFDLPYHHVGQRLWIDWPRKRVRVNPKKDDSLRFESVEDHCVSRYAARIYELMPNKYRKQLSKIVGSKAAYASHPHYWLKPVKGKDEESHKRTVPTFW